MSAIAKISKNVQPVGETGGRSLGLPVFPEKVKQLLQPRSTRGRFTEDGEFIGVSDDWLAVAVSGNDLQEVETALEHVRDILRPAEKGYILTRVLTLLSHYRQEQNPPQVERMIAEDWADDLGEFPPWVIDEAARWWRRNKVFRPSICEIRRLCVGYVAPEITVRNRLVTIIEKSDRRLGRRQNETVGLASRAIKRIPGGTGTIGR